MSATGEGTLEPPPGLSQEAAGDVDTIVRGGSVQVIGQIVSRNLSFFFGAIFVRILDKASFGLYRVVVQILSNAGQLGIAGFNYAAMRWAARARGNEVRGGIKGAAIVGVSGAAIVSGLVVVGLLVFAEPLARVFENEPRNRPEVVDLIRLGAVYVPLFALLQVLRYVTQAFKTMVPSVMAGNIVQPAVRFVLATAALLAFESVTGAIVALNISVAVAVVVAIWYVVRMLGPEELRSRPVFEVGAMTRFAFPQAGASLLGVQTLGVGLLILASYSGRVEAGIFAIALALQGPGNVFLGGIVNIWAPVVADLHGRGEMERLDSLYKTINRWIVTFSFPVYAALLIMPEVFATAFAGDDAGGVAPVLAVLAIGNIFYSGTGPTGYVLSMTGRPGINFINSVVAVALFVGLGIVVAPDHGALGIAVVDAIVTALVNSARVIEARYLVGVQPFGRTFYKPVVATLIGAAVLLLWKLLPVDSLIFDGVGIAVAAAVYVFVLKRLGIDEEERHVIDRIRARALRRKG